MPEKPMAAGEIELAVQKGGRPCLQFAYPLACAWHREPSADRHGSQPMTRPADDCQRVEREPVPAPSYIHCLLTEQWLCKRELATPVGQRFSHS